MGVGEFNLCSSDTVESVLLQIVSTLQIDAINHLMIPQRPAFLNMPCICI